MHSDLNKNSYLRISQAELSTYHHLKEGYQKTYDNLGDKNSDYANQLVWIIDFYDTMFCSVNNHLLTYEESIRNAH